MSYSGRQVPRFPTHSQSEKVGEFALGVPPGRAIARQTILSNDHPKCNRQRELGVERRARLRTIGAGWAGLRPARSDGTNPNWGRAAGRQVGDRMEVSRGLRPVARSGTDPVSPGLLAALPAVARGAVTA